MRRWPVWALPTVGALIAAGSVLGVVVAAGSTARSPSGPGAPRGIQVLRDDPAAARYAGTEILPPPGRPAFTLLDTSGRPFDFAKGTAGTVTSLFFGYTHCPDVCPTTMADLVAARRALPRPVAGRVLLVFVTEDPRRDAPGVLRAWLDRFDRDVTGLEGGNATTRALLTRLRLPASGLLGTPGPDGGTVQHSGVVYLFGPDDRTAVVHTGGSTPDQYAADMAALAGTVRP